MKWRGRRESENVEDLRGAPMRGPALGGSLGVIVLALLAMYFGVDPRIVTETLGPGGMQQIEPSEGSYQGTSQEEELKRFVSVVLADTEDTWKAVFRRLGTNYQEPKLVLYTGMVHSACGLGQAAMGPFYCPGDQKVYIDLAFYEEMKRRFGAPGDFAQAYVVAHEVGHHVQTLLGISDKVRKAQSRVSREDANRIQVKMELQADCLAGVWGYHADRARGLLEAGDVEEALNAAAAIGDDRLQRQMQGHVVPESFTHGTSEQRVRWFRRGLQTGSLEACDTFSAPAL